MSDDEMPGISDSVCWAGRFFTPYSTKWTTPCEEVAVFSITATEDVPGAPEPIEARLCKTHVQDALANGLDPDAVLLPQCAAGRRITRAEDNPRWNLPCFEPVVKPYLAAFEGERVVLWLCAGHFDELPAQQEVN